MTPTLDQQREAWSRPPVDDVGYIPATELLRLSDEGLRDVIVNMERARYGGWRNHDGLWREVLGLDTTHSKWVLDYGCGVGLEALQYAKAGNHVWVADIVPNNVVLAMRVLRLYGYEPTGASILFDDTKFEPGSFEIIHCAGVLQHIPDPVPVVQRMHEWLYSGGELRLMVYSNEGWWLTTGTAPPEDVTNHPMRGTFVRAFDAVGEWADWYDQARLEARFGEWFAIARCQHITPDHRYLAAVLRRRDE